MPVFSKLASPVISPWFARSKNSVQLYEQFFSQLLRAYIDNSYLELMDWLDHHRQSIDVLLEYLKRDNLISLLGSSETCELLDMWISPELQKEIKDSYAKQRALQLRLSVITSELWRLINESGAVDCGFCGEYPLAVRFPDRFLPCTKTEIGILILAAEDREKIHAQLAKHLFHIRWRGGRIKFIRKLYSELYYTRKGVSLRLKSTVHPKYQISSIEHHLFQYQQLRLSEGARVSMLSDHWLLAERLLALVFHPGEQQSFRALLLETTLLIDSFKQESAWLEFFESMERAGLKRYAQESLRYVLGCSELADRYHLLNQQLPTSASAPCLQTHGDWQRLFRVTVPGRFRHFGLSKIRTTWMMNREVG